MVTHNNVNCSSTKAQLPKNFIFHVTSIPGNGKHLSFFHYTKGLEALSQIVNSNSQAPARICRHVCRGGQERQRRQAQVEQRDEGEVGGRHRFPEKLHPVERVELEEERTGDHLILPFDFVTDLNNPKKNNGLYYKPGNTKGGSTTVPLTSCLTGLESAV
jgi:hypothetical protein